MLKSTDQIDTKARLRASGLVAVLIALLVLLLAGCGPQTTGSGLSQDEVCERFLTMLGEAGGMTHAEDSAGGVTSPPQAVQHRAQATAALAFAQEARPVADPGLAAQVAAVESEAQRVLDELDADAGDAEAETATEPLYRATAELYAVCVADAYRALLEGEVELTGACAEPDAPTLEGPNVIVYGSGGHDFVSSTCELVEGERRGDGCAYSGTETGSADLDGHVFASVEVAYDPDTCRALFESGPVSAPQ